ncbi:MAG TPA: phage tail protein [Blastocatellia bacterium]|nr:phage tail protein [Blastocatellia bacterium]
MADQLLRSFRFQIKLRKSAAVESGSQTPSDSPSGTPLGDGAFQECSGLEINTDVQEYLEGGRNDGVIKRVGRAKYSAITLKRGMLFSSGGAVNREMWRWVQGVCSGERPVARYDGIIQVMSSGDNVVATWVFDRGLPLKIRGPELNAKTGDVAIEELQIAHEGLRLVES